MEIINIIFGDHGSVRSTIAISLTWSILAFGIMKGIGSILSKNIIENISLWLLGACDDTWCGQFSVLMDKIFGKKHFSIRCLFLSSVSSFFFVILIYITFVCIGFMEDDSRSGGHLNFFNAIITGSILNIIPDYISLLETRYILKKIKDLKNYFSISIFIFIDFILSGLIIFTSINFYKFIVNEKFVTLAQMIGAFDEYSIFFYASFFTSIFAWIYCISTFVMRLFSKTFLKDILCVEEKPLSLIGIISSVLLFIFLSLASFLFNSETVNELWCSNFSSTCSGVYRLTRDESKAFKYLSKVCEGNDMDLCLKKANEYFVGDTEKAFSLWKKSCDNGSGTGCLNIGWMYRTGQNIPNNDKLAYDFFHKSCECNNYRGCFRLGEMYLEGFGVESDINIAFDLFRQLCDRKDNFSCSKLVDIYHGRFYNKLDNPRRVQLLRLICDLNEASSCMELGTKLYFGEGVDKNKEESVAILKRFCNKDDIRGCVRLNGILQRERSEYREKSEVDKYYDECEQGNSLSCLKIAKMNQLGFGIERNTDKAKMFFHRACDMNLYESCYILGIIYDKEKDNKESINKSKYLLKIACNNGINEACLEN